MKRRRQACGFKRESIANEPGERQPQEQPLGVGAHEPHQAQGLAVGADEDVQAVVEREVAVIDPPGPSTQGLCRLEYRDRNASLGERDRGRHAGVTAADHGHVHGMDRINKINKIKTTTRTERSALFARVLSMLLLQSCRSCISPSPARGGR